MSKSNATTETSSDESRKERVGESQNYGLFMRGYIQGRTRKFFEASGKFRYCYIFIVNGIRQLVFSWDAENVLPVGIEIEVPVIISSYSDRKNNLHTQITIRSNNGDFGEEAF